MSRRPPLTGTPEDTETVVLRPGDIHFGGGNTRISTLLGSCVSITLWHPHKRIGGMCHYMMAGRSRPLDGAGHELDGRYATEAFAFFLLHIERTDTRPSEYQAKLFGGANMFGGKPDTRFDVGKSNIEFARQLLVSHQIPLVAEHIGGSGRRKLHFDLWSGNVWLSFPEGSGAMIRNGNG
ncbi:MAG: chemotaxis protein CheD [Propionivibrio sp.]